MGKEEEEKKFAPKNFIIKDSVFESMEIEN